MSKAIYSSDLFGTYDLPTFVIWDSNTANCPYKSGLTQGQEGFAIVYGTKTGWHTVIAFQKGGLCQTVVGNTLLKEVRMSDGLGMQ